MPEHTARDGSGHFVRTIEGAERDAECARLKAQGWTYTRLAERYKVNKRACIEMVHRAFEAAGRDDRNLALAMERVKLDAMETAVLDVLARSHITVSNGRVVSINGEPILDDAPVLQAVAQWLKISERRSKLLGLDAPARQTVTVVTESVVDAEILRLEAELAARS